MRNKTVLYIAQSALIAALYVSFGYVSQLFGLASGAIQVRISEAFCVFAAFTPAAVPGLAIGCCIFNLTSGLMIQDVLFGTLATLIGAACTYVMAKAFSKKKAPLKSVYGIVTSALLPLPTVLANAFIVPYVLIKFYKAPDAYWFLFMTVGLGEFIAAEIIGLVIYYAIQPVKHIVFTAE